MRKIIYILLLVVVLGCQKPQQPKIEQKYHVQMEMSPAMKEAVMTLVWMKSDPNVFKVKELDPFRRQ